MENIKYKGFEISPAPYKLKESDAWIPSVSLIKHHDDRGETLAKTFSGRNTYKTESEAKTHAIELGKQIIDGKYPDIVTTDLL